MQLLDRFIGQVFYSTHKSCRFTEVSKVEQLRIAITTESPAEPDRMRHEPLLMLFIDFQAQCCHVCSSKRARSRQSLYPEMSSFYIQLTCATANNSHDNVPVEICMRRLNLSLHSRTVRVWAWQCHIKEEKYGKQKAAAIWEASNHIKASYWWDGAVSSEALSSSSAAVLVSSSADCSYQRVFKAWCRRIQRDSKEF